MLALTLHQPWAWAVAHGGKRVENRTWHPPRSLLGHHLAIHAAAPPRRKADRETMMELVRQLGAPLPGQGLTFSAVVAVVKVTGSVESPARLEPDQRKWFIGPLGWTLDDVVALGCPVEAKGAQRLWRLDEALTGHVRLQWREAKGQALTEDEQERLALQDPRFH